MNYSNSAMGTINALEHLSDETMDLYACGRLHGEALDAADEHLLICAGCQERQRQHDEFFRSLLASPVAHQARRDVEKKIAARARRFSAGWWLVPAFAMLGFVLYPRPAGPPAEVTLLAMRGVPSGIQAPAGRPFVLRLDLTGLEIGEPLRVDLVNAAGRLRNSATASLDNHLATTTVGSVPAGKYWVRLYRGDVLLREYALTVGP